jgi:hypothetical protein
VARICQIRGGRFKNRSRPPGLWLPPVFPPFVCGREGG